MQICKILIITVALLLLSGCVTDRYSEGQKGLFETVKDMWNYDYSKDPVDWKQQAEFYRDNYPDSTQEEKAKMLMESMKKHNDKYTTTTKMYTVTVTQVFDNAGLQIWPVNNIEPRGAGQLSKFADTMTELGDTVGTKKESSPLSDIEKQVEKNDDVI